MVQQALRQPRHIAGEGPAGERDMAAGFGLLKRDGIRDFVHAG